MGKKKSFYGRKLPVFTRGKVIRLVLCAVFAAAAIILNRYVPAVRTFGWGFVFGLLCMAALTG